MARKTTQSAALLGLILTTASTQAQLFEVDYAAPTLDRWNYPFNGAPGFRLSASTFGAPTLEGFDDRDAQLAIGFETFADIPLGLDSSEYRVLSATVTITNTSADVFRYDPTYDSHDTYLYLDDSLDTDPGRPVSLWALGYRYGFDQTTWGEFSAFGGPAVVDPVQESRNAFAAYFPVDQTAVDVSNNVKQQFDPTPMALAQTDSVVPGDLIPADTTFTFEVDLCDPLIRGYLSESLAIGEVRFAVSSMHLANGGDGGGTGDVTYPFWYTRENPIAEIFGYASTLNMRVRIGSAGDYDGNGAMDFFDVSAFLADFTSGNLDADLTGDCAFDFFDVSAFLTAFSAG